jgi:hypothetical protein
MGHRILRSLVSALLLTGCSAAMVMATSDPAEKVANVRELIRAGRWAPAERMLREVHEISPKDFDGFVSRGEAHVLYWHFLLSDWASAPLYKPLIDSIGGKDKLPDVRAEHLALAERDYLAADALAASTSQFFLRSNIAWRLAGVYVLRGDKIKACGAMDASLVFHRQGASENPNAKVQMFGDYANSTYADMIASEKKKARCESSNP